ncbi:MerR family transcriptional regulator [Saccharibacillus sp. O23]|uniref:MerR family transcriptional regulator n=1 Tax=Saccharibacillus sp. O23 TaxID=2009338 RepID=UPI000B4DFFD0|nr:MerR family transcriptional regulator [Saccharibacillus sp. O23]OWR27130.1 MerR family transcriptional regulator [Saccharibacillus sp. O23]
MSKRWLTVHEVARITGATVRALHHYDRIGLLKPASVGENGYRLYDRDNLERLQIILFLKEADVSLQEIAALLERPEAERRQALHKHRERLTERKRELERTIDAFDRYLAAGTIFGPEPPELSGVPLREQYEREAEAVYGRTEAYAEYKRREEERERLPAAERERAFSETERRMNGIFAELASFMEGRSAGSPDVQARIADWHETLKPYVDANPELLRHIAENYRNDRRFRAYFDAFGGRDGEFGRFLHEAIDIYCRSLTSGPE